MSLRKNKPFTIEPTEFKFIRWEVNNYVFSMQEINPALISWTLYLSFNIPIVLQKFHLFPPRAIESSGHTHRSSMRP